MAPDVSPLNRLHYEYNDELPTKFPNENPQKSTERKLQLVWVNIIFFLYLHMMAPYGLYLCLTSAKWATVIHGFCTLVIGGYGVTAGAHRLWAHRSYKAKWPLKLLLLYSFTMAFQNSVIEWARDHRVHHKFTETDADPHNAKRGFFFSHVGWLLSRKHPDIKNKGKSVDISDLEADSLLKLQHKYYLILMPMCCFIIPTLTPWYFWNETFWTSLYVNLLRYVLGLNATWAVNSAAHLWGSKPYDRFINPAQNIVVSIVAVGEGWHNYHHTFPWDYKTSELGNYTCNWTTALIDFFAKIGWAYDAKTVSPQMIKKRVFRTGDGSHEIWGWGDKDQPKDDYADAIILHGNTG